ncbi:MAG: hypothetical protein DYH12_16285 [Sorangiineae bacterium PRO1]|nr:hypothetical protein [Sorangiineae bacterium PRO1]
MGHCGSSSPQPGPTGNCYCDAQCVAQNDCCPGYKDACASGQVACGADQCELGSGERCCHKYGSGSWSSACQPQSQACSGIATSNCDGPEDCPGQVCCGKVANNYLSSMTCEAASACQYSSGYRVICGASGQCPSGYVCKTLSSPPGYKYCGVP